MSKVRPGTYSLRNAASPSPLVGILAPGPPVQPVVTYPDEKIWIVEVDPDGKYVLRVAGINCPCFADARGDAVDVGPERVEWVVEGPDGGPNTIHARNRPSKVWTVYQPDNGSKEHRPVLLEDLRPGPPENQKWYFVPPQ